MPEDLEWQLTKENLLAVLEHSPIGILYFSAGWEIKLINENFLNFGVLGHMEKSSLANVHLLQSALPDILKIREELSSLPQTAFFEKEIKNILTTDGANISVIVKGTALFTQDIFTGGILVLEDIKTVDNAKKDHIFHKPILDHLTHKLSDLFFITDAALFIKYVSMNKPGTILPLTEELFNQKAGDVLKPLFKEDINSLISFFLESKKQYKGKITSSGSPDDQKIFELNLIPYLNDYDALQFVYIVLKDITAEESENLRRIHELAELKQYQFITSAVTDAVIATDLEGKITFWNKSAENLFRYSRSEVFGKFIGKVIHDLDSKYFEELKKEIFKNSIWESEVKTSNYEGEEEFISIKVSLTGEEYFRNIILLCSSVTERTRVEKELRISEERFRNIVINAAEFICNIDLEGYITYVNPKFIRTFEYTEGELHEKNIRDLLDADAPQNRDFDIRRFLYSSSGPLELCLLTRSGKKVYIIANFSPILNFDNSPKYYNGIFTDITEKKQAEEDLLMVRSAFEASRDGISVEVERRFILVNDAFAKMFGYQNVADVFGRDSLDVVANEDIPVVAKYIQAREKRSQAPDNYDFMGKRKDGSLFYVETSVTSYELNNHVYIVKVCRDITERKRAQQALRESEEKYRSITENIEDFLWTAERIGGKLRPVFYTSTIEQVTGYTQDQFIADSKLWFKVIYPNDLRMYKKKFMALLKDAARSSTEIELRIFNKSGSLVWVRNKINVKRNSHGQAERLFGLVSDITLSKKAAEELKKSADELREINNTKDKFISIISHDLRTPFSSILGFTDLLLGDSDLPEKQRIQYITFIQESSRNMLSLVNSLLDWTRLQTGRMKFEPVRLNAKDVIDKSITIMAGAAIQKNIQLNTTVKESVFVHADFNLLLQVINNLISNAIKFTPDGGSITLSAHPVIQGNQIQFALRDTGVGIKPENIEKLFKVDSKFTLDGTKGEKGSGLGLSIVNDIIEKHGGRIWVNSEFGAGTEFNFTLPVAASNILIVDDSKTDRLLYSKILKNIIPNYRIDMADNGREALDMILKSPPALVITDHFMPVMSGYELVKHLMVSDLKGKPPVIILSGDITKNIMDEYREINVEYVFQKPVNLSNFKDAIERSLRKAVFN